MPRPHLKIAAIAAAIAVPTLGSAADLQYELRGGVAYSDNVERTATDELATGAAVVGAKVRGARDSGRLRFGLAGDVAYYEYFENDVEGEVIGSLFGESSYDIIPERFRWDLDGSFTQIRQSLLRPATPSNRDDAITLSTGPTFVTRFGDATEAQIDARYTRSDYSRRDFDSNTLEGRLIVGRRMSRRSLIGVGVSIADVKYDSQSGLASIDFKRTEAFLRLTTAGVRTTLDLDAGIAKADGDNVDDQGLVMRLQATRKLTPFVSGFAAYTQEYPTSEVSSFQPIDAVQGGDPGDGSILTAAPRVVKNAELGLRMDRPRTSVVLAYALHRETELIQPVRERKYDTLRASLSRSLTPRSRAGLFATFTQEDFDDSTLDTDETSVGGELSLTFGRELGLDFRIEHRKRDGFTTAEGYSELSGGLFLRYGRISGRAATRTVTPTAYLPR